jgi:hypothetical protein
LVLSVSAREGGHEIESHAGDPAHPLPYAAHVNSN